MHQLGFSYRLTTALPREANSAAQTAFLGQVQELVTEVAAG